MDVLPPNAPHSLLSFPFLSLFLCIFFLNINFFFLLSRERGHLQWQHEADHGPHLDAHSHLPDPQQGEGHLNQERHVGLGQHAGARPGGEELHQRLEQWDRPVCAGGQD